MLKEKLLLTYWWLPKIMLDDRKDVSNWKYLVWFEAPRSKFPIELCWCITLLPRETILWSSFSSAAPDFLLGLLDHLQLGRSTAIIRHHCSVVLTTCNGSPFGSLHIVQHACNGTCDWFPECSTFFIAFQHAWDQIHSSTYILYIRTWYGHTCSLHSDMSRQTLLLRSLLYFSALRSTSLGMYVHTYSLPYFSHTCIWNGGMEPHGPFCIISMPIHYLPSTFPDGAKRNLYMSHPHLPLQQPYFGNSSSPADA